MSTIKVDTIQKANGTSQIGIDKIGGVTAAGTINVIAEGGTNTTNLANGLLKAWDYYDGSASGAASYGDSLNIASTTDNGTGDYTHAFTNAMATASQYGAITSGHRRNGGPGDGPTAHATASVTHLVHNDAGSAADQTGLSLCVFGDLA